MDFFRLLLGIKSLLLMNVDGFHIKASFCQVSLFFLKNMEICGEGILLEIVNPMTIYVYNQFGKVLNV